MNCTRCNNAIIKGQPYARTKKGPHHFHKKDCKRSPIETVDTLWACSCGFMWFSYEPPKQCPSCHIFSSSESGETQK